MARRLKLPRCRFAARGKNRLVRVYIDKPGGVTHGDCELISHKLGELLDEQDAVLGASLGDGYTLEVSSPGIERRLSKPRDFEKAVGQKIKLTTARASRRPYQPRRQAGTDFRWQSGSRDLRRATWCIYRSIRFAKRI